MRKAEFLRHITAFAFVLLLAVPLATMAQQNVTVAHLSPQEVQAQETAASETSAPEVPAQIFRPEELDQMLAPIALYPDALLAQILTAATYPLDIVAAERFVKEHPLLKGDELVEVAKDKEWSPSVKAMLQFPDILAMMDKQLEWTTKLGDAFLAQQRDVMDSAQRLRQKANAQGNLKSNQQEVVRVDPQTQYIVIEQADPQVVYVPVYDPTIVYGAWWYPDYPPYYFYYPGYVGGFYLPGFFVSVGWGWGVWGCDWYHRDININVNHYNDFARHSYHRPEHYEMSNARGNVTWRHNPEYRRSAGYHDYWTAQRFGGRQVSGAGVTTATSTFRRTEQGPTSTMSTTRVSSKENFRSSHTTTPTGYRENLNRTSTSQGISVPRQSTINYVPQRTVSQSVSRPSGGEVSRGRESLWSGAGSGGSERAASSRGQSTFQNTRSGGSSGGGGGSHGGGGRGGRR